MRLTERLEDSRIVAVLPVFGDVPRGAGHGSSTSVDTSHLLPLQSTYEDDSVYFYRCSIYGTAIEIIPQSFV